MQVTPVGELLLNLLMQKGVIDTRTRVPHFRENLTNLETYITTVKSNIKTLNLHVKVNMEGFKARGERTEDLMKNLFKAYQVASDKYFVRYL